MSSNARSNLLLSIPSKELLVDDVRESDINLKSDSLLWVLWVPRVSTRQRQTETEQSLQRIEEKPGDFRRIL